MPRGSLLFVALALAVCAPQAARAGDVAAAASAPAAAYPEVFLTPEGFAASGYDVVSFFENAPMKGDPAIFSDRGGARYLFATAAHKAAFDANPARYQPQFGGFCAFGAAAGHKSPRPETGQVIGGKLYFNYNADVQKKFNTDQTGYISRAGANWDRIKRDKPVG